MTLYLQPTAVSIVSATSDISISNHTRLRNQVSIWDQYRFFTTGFLDPHPSLFLVTWEPWWWKGRNDPADG
jgi:hypothetical protein